MRGTMIPYVITVLRLHIICGTDIPVAWWPNG